MSCCNPCGTSVTYENRRAEEQAAKTNKELQQKLENTLKELAELKAKQAEMTSHPCCPLFKVESITKAGSEVLITFDNCTFVKAPMSIVDNALMQGKSEENSTTVEGLKQALEELKTKVQTLEGKEDKDTVFDPSSLEARVTALEATKGIGSFDLSALEARLSALESKEDKDTIFDPSSLIGRISALEGKEDKDTVYDDTAIRNLITALQNKEDKDTIFDPSALEARVKALEDTPAGDKVDTTAFVRKADLVDIQNFEGNVMFRAFPTTEAPVEATAETEAQPVVPAPAAGKPQ